MTRHKLILIATTQKWNIELGAEEIGNALYPLDENILIELDSLYPLIYVFSEKLTPRKAFQAIIREPPAYLERLVPVDELVDDNIYCEHKNLELSLNLTSVLARILQGLESVNVEAKPRKYHIVGKCSEKELNRLLTHFISNAIGIRVLRRSAKTLKIEDTRYGIVLALIGNGWDRLSYWRKKRLGELTR